jgi:peptide/nickel transport system ATP-binding protein
VPSLRDEIKGCPFAPRCTFASGRCEIEMPPLERKTPAHLAACFHSDRIAR